MPIWTSQNQPTVWDSLSSLGLRVYYHNNVSFAYFCWHFLLATSCSSITAWVCSCCRDGFWLWSMGSLHKSCFWTPGTHPFSGEEKPLLPACQNFSVINKPQKPLSLRSLTWTYKICIHPMTLRLFLKSADNSDVGVPASPIQSGRHPTGRVMFLKNFWASLPLNSDCWLSLTIQGSTCPFLFPTSTAPPPTCHFPQVGSPPPHTTFTFISYLCSCV